MKSLYLVALPALLASHTASAQQLRLGVKSGLNYASGRIRNVTGYSRVLGFSGGAVARYSFTPGGVWNAQAELLFSARGDKDKNGYTGAGARTTYIYRRNYLELPIVGKIKAHGVTLEAGPQLAYLLSIPDNNPDIYSRYYILQNYKSFKPFQVGYVVGVGYELPTGLSLTLRYSDDFTKLYKDVPGFDATNPHNSMFQAQLGYLFGAQQ